MVDFAKKLEELRWKKAYVQRQGQTRQHTCHAQGCQEPCKPAYFMCRKHWFMVPKPLRDAVWREYHVGQEQGVAGVTRSYLAVTRQAIEAVANKEGKTMAKKTGTSIAKWDEELARQAEAAAGMEASVAAGQFFSLRGGQLTYNDAPLPGNQVAVVILDAVLENVYYEGAFDPDSPQSPTCFAFGRDEKTMAPHETVVEAGQQQHDACAGCAHNEFGSADKGKGKACRNTRRLALLSAGSLNERTGEFEPEDNLEHFKNSQVAFMKLPVTSIKAYAAFVKQIAGTLKRPPHGIFTRIRVVPDPKTQFKVTFEALGLIPDPIMGAVMDRHKETGEVIMFPYQLEDEDAKPKAGKNGKAKGKAVKAPPANVQRGAKAPKF